MSKQDRQGVRTINGLEQKYQFGHTFAEIMGIATDAQRNAEEAKEIASEAESNLTSEEIFNILTQNGTVQGLYRDDNGDLYFNGEYIKAGTFTSTAEVYIEPGVEELETVKNHLLGKEIIPANRIALYDTDGSGTVNITDHVRFQSWVLGKESISSWPNAVKSIVTVTVDATNLEKTVKISGTNMWGREVVSYIGLTSGNIGRHNGSLLINGILSIGGDITISVNADGRATITGLTDPVDSTDAVNKAYVDGKSEVVEVTAGVVTETSGNVTYTYPFTYRIIKKANGFVEIFGTSDEFETSITKGWGSLCESNPLTLPQYGITLTSVLFCQASFASSPGQPIAWTEGCFNDVTSPGATYLCRADQVQSIKGKLCSYTVGTWK